MQQPTSMADGHDPSWLSLGHDDWLDVIDETHVRLDPVPITLKQLRLPAPLPEDPHPNASTSAATATNSLPKPTCFMASLLVVENRVDLGHLSHQAFTARGNQVPAKPDGGASTAWRAPAAYHRAVRSYAAGAGTCEAA
jgi:hypothetical protein